MASFFTSGTFRNIRTVIKAVYLREICQINVIDTSAADKALILRFQIFIPCHMNALLISKTSFANITVAFKKNYTNPFFMCFIRFLDNCPFLLHRQRKCCIFKTLRDLAPADSVTFATASETLITLLTRPKPLRLRFAQRDCEIVSAATLVRVITFAGFCDQDFSFIRSFRTAR